MATSSKDPKQTPSANKSAEHSDADETSLEAQESIATTGKSLLQESGLRVIKKIGSGSYSKVKLAYSEAHKSMVAVKVVSKYHVPDEFLRKFLYSEVKVVKFLKHENVIRYFHSMESTHRLYVVMQYAENGSILDLIHKEKRLSEARANVLFRQIIAGVEYCHSEGVSHRDIKCENILLDQDFTVKLIDFGFAKSYKPSTKSSGQEKLDAAIGAAAFSHTSGRSSSSSRRKERDAKFSETYCGSYAYASPEILRGIPYDPFLADVWAMGVVLFAMVFGRLPFDDRDAGKLIKQVQQPVVFPSSVKASDSCKACIRKLLSPLKHRYTIESLKADAWVTTEPSNLSQTTSSSARKLSTR